MARVRVQAEDFDVGRELEALTRGRRDVGAVASFVGLVRDANDGHAIAGMTLEHYPGMTEKALEQICAEAHERWELLDTTLPQIDLADAAAVARFIVSHLGLNRARLVR